MDYKAKDYNHLLGTKGFSDKLLENHFKLYEGYVKNANKLLGSLEELWNKNDMESPEFSEIKRRLGFELDGIKMHELYFDNMKKGGREFSRNSKLFKKLSEEFDSFPKWEKTFKAVGSIRGIGWVSVIYDPSVDKILNTWIGEHHIGHVPGTAQILVMDLWEHAMLLDYGSDRAAYMESFMNAIDWQTAEARFEAAAIRGQKESTKPNLSETILGLGKRGSHATGKTLARSR